MLDCLIIGGGIIGWAIGDELARTGREVTLVDLARFSDSKQAGQARTASLASAGILPPPITRATHDPLETLRVLSDKLFADWAKGLQADTGVDVDYKMCGGIYLARTSGESAALQFAVEDWHRDGVEVEEISVSALSASEPHIDFSDVQRAYRLAAEQRVRPAALTTALAIRARQNGVTFQQSTQSVRLTDQQDRAIAIVDGDNVEALEIIVAAGPWSTELLRPFGFDIGVEPRRGQIAMWQCDAPIISHVINEGPRYVLCRADGELIAGSTVEEVDFDCNTTTEGIQSLVAFAAQLVPSIRQKDPDTTWAGLRPHARDGYPSIGRVAATDNLTVATGHFRSGIHLAPATALLVRQAIDGESPAIDVAPFAARRN